MFACTVSTPSFAVSCKFVQGEEQKKTEALQKLKMLLLSEDGVSGFEFTCSDCADAIVKSTEQSLQSAALPRLRPYPDLSRTQVDLCSPRGVGLHSCAAAAHAYVPSARAIACLSGFRPARCPVTCWLFVGYSNVRAAFVHMSRVH